MSDETASPVPTGATAPAPSVPASTPGAVEVPPASPADAAPSGGDEPPPSSAEERDAQEKKDAEEASEAAKRLSERKQQVRERINQLRREAGDWERRALLAEQRLRDYDKRVETRPDPAQYTDPVKYEDDQREYQAVDLRRRDAKLEAEEVARQAAAVQVQAWQARVEEYAADVPDFQQVAYSAPINDAVSHAVLRMEDGPAIAYYLGKNPATATRLNSMTPADMAVELGRISGRLQAPAPKRVSQAPPPLKTVQGRSGSPTPDINKMSMEEYARHRQAQLKAERG